MSGLEPYLTLDMFSHHRRLLTLCRLNRIPQFMFSDGGWLKASELPVCTSDNVSPPDTPHIVLLCPRFNTLRYKYIRPSLLPLNVRQAYPALMFLKLLTLLPMYVFLYNGCLIEMLRCNNILCIVLLCCIFHVIMWCIYEFALLWFALVKLNNVYWLTDITPDTQKYLAVCKTRSWNN